MKWKNVNLTMLDTALLFKAIEYVYKRNKEAVLMKIIHDFVHLKSIKQKLYQFKLKSSN